MNKKFLILKIIKQNDHGRGAGPYDQKDEAGVRRRTQNGQQLSERFKQSFVLFFLNNLTGGDPKLFRSHGYYL